jgi:putative hydrolase of the HAD superfamily
MGSRKTILFDLGGVLVGARGREALMALLPHLSEAEVLERWLGSSVVNRFESGLIDAAAFADEFIADWALELNGDEFIDNFGGWVTGFYDGAEELLGALRLQHRLACLSNTNAVHWARLTDVQKQFDACFASHLIGHMKPAPAAYAHVLRALEVAPREVWFFDDLAANVVAAREAGINAFHVSGFDDLAPILRSEGLLARRDVGA